MAIINIIYVVMLIFGILQIILFFKVWGNKYLKDEDEKRRQEVKYDPSPKISGGVKPTI